jgi:hypothetical protein
MSTGPFPDLHVLLKSYVGRKLVKILFPENFTRLALVLVLTLVIVIFQMKYTNGDEKHMSRQLPEFGIKMKFLFLLIVLFSLQVHRINKQAKLIDIHSFMPYQKYCYIVPQGIIPECSSVIFSKLILPRFRFWSS